MMKSDLNCEQRRANHSYIAKKQIRADKLRTQERKTQKKKLWGTNPHPPLSLPPLACIDTWKKPTVTAYQCLDCLVLVHTNKIFHGFTTLAGKGQGTHGLPSFETWSTMSPLHTYISPYSSSPFVFIIYSCYVLDDLSTLYR